MPNPTIYIFVLAVLAAAGHPAATAVAADDPVADRLAQLEAELERVRQDNREMRQEIDELRATSDENWLTEQRAREVRAIVHDVLADAETRASLLGDGLMAGWSDGFFLSSADGRFMLRLSGQMQVRYVYNYHSTPDEPLIPPNVPTAQGIPQDVDSHLHGFENPRTRLAFHGHVFGPDLEYMIRADFGRQGGDPGRLGLLDAWIRYRLTNEWSVRFGQFKLPFDREFLVSSAHQLAAERSLISENMSLRRSTGLEITYADDVHRISGAFSDGGQDWMSMFSSVGFGTFATAHPQPVNIGALTRTVEYAWTARYEHLLAGTWDQFRDFTSPVGEEFGILLGAAIHLQRDEAGIPAGTPGVPTSQNTRRFGYTLDASIEWGGANAFVAFHHQNLDHRHGTPVAFRQHYNIFGVVAQGGVYVTPRTEVFGRYEFGKWNFDPPPGFEDMNDSVHLLTLGVNYYLDGHDAKWTTDIGFGLTNINRAWGNRPGETLSGWRAEGEGAEPQVVFRTQFQLLF